MRDTKDLFSENLRFLHKSNKILAERLKKSLFINQNVEILSSKSGLPTAKVDGILLHSLYDPLLEADRLLKSYELKGIELVIIFGFGLGYHALELAKRIDQETKILIIEPRLNIFRSAMKRMDLSPLLSKDIRLSVGDDIPDIIELLNDEDVLTAKYLLIEHPPSIRLSMRHLLYIRLLLSGRKVHQKKRQGLSLTEDDFIQLLIEGILFKNWPNRTIKIHNILTFPRPSYMKALVIQLASIGDVVYTTPVFLGIKERFGDIKLYLLTESQNCELVRDDPNLNGVIAFDKERFLRGLFSPDGLEKTRLELREFVQDIRGKGFDLVINLHTSPRSAALARLIACKETWGLTLDDHGLPCVLGHPWVHYRYWAMKEGVSSLGIVELHLLMANASLTKRETRIYIDKGLKKKVKRLFDSYGIKDGFIGLFPGSNYPSRRWSKENFAHLGDLIQSVFNTRVIIFGGPNDQDLGDYITRSMKLTDWINLAGKTSLRELACILERCSIFITNDSGPLHIACAVKTPSITIAGPAWIGPYGQGHLLLLARLPCIGCPKYICNTHTCMKLITPQGVILAIEILKELRKGVRDEEKIKRLLNSPILREIEILYSGDKPPGKLFSLAPLIRPVQGINAIKEAITRLTLLNLWDIGKTPYLSPDEIVDRLRKDYLIEDGLNLINELVKVKEYLKELYLDDRRRAMPLFREIEYLTILLKEGSSELRKKAISRVIETLDGVIELLGEGYGLV